MLFSMPLRSEINEHTAKLIVGLIAISLASIEYILTGGNVNSISESYYANGWARNIFVGFLFAIAAFMFTYNGKEPCQKLQMVLSKIAAFAALGVALFPCKCVTHQEIIPHIHGTSAAVMFSILAIFCYFFFLRAWGKNRMPARIRAVIYALCGVAIATSILILAIDHFSNGSISEKIKNLTFIFENVGLVSFGIAWFTAGGYFFLPEIKGEEIKNNSQG